jgi:DNA polymerase-3 subunit epsilon
MFRNLVLARSLTLIDLESTGLNPHIDRIVEISVLKIHRGGASQHVTCRLNPGVPIPAEASGIHGIYDADVAGQPRFRDIAASLQAFLAGSDLAGFNLRRFDLRLLQAEFQRAGLFWSLEGRSIIDAMEIFHRYERRDLAAAVGFYLGRPHDGAHSASADVLAAAQVLDAMLGRYADLPRTVDALHMRFQDPNAVDGDRRFVRVGGEIRMNFGPHRGQPLAVVAQVNPGFLRWMLGQDFQDDAKRIVVEALACGR